MVDNIVTKPLGLVLVVMAHTVFNGPIRENITGILGANITLQLTFNTSIGKNSHYAVYVTGENKIAECLPHEKCKPNSDVIHPGNHSVIFRIINLTRDHSKTYWASLVTDKGPILSNNKVHLTIRQENRSSTVSPTKTYSTIAQDRQRGSSTLFSRPMIALLVVLPVVLLAATLPWFVWRHVQTKNKQQQTQQQQQQQQQQHQQNSNPTDQGTAEASSDATASSVFYSVLDFPKRPPSVLLVNPSDTEYAAVSYGQEERQV